MIEVSHLTKRYGSKSAVDDISFTVKKGEILGFLGPNGAGKSTTMNILTGYISATEGSAKIGEYDILENPNEAKKQIGYLPEQPPLYLDMTVKEYLEFMYDLKKVKLNRNQHIKEVCEQVKITDVFTRVIKNLSKGYRQRVGLAQAMLGNPDVLILDEPTVGLDPKQILEIRTLIKNLGEKHTVILSSHILSEVQAVCERVIIINRGKIIADGTPDGLSKELSPDRSLVVRVQGPEDKIQEALEKIRGVEKVVAYGEKEPKTFDFELHPAEGEDIRTRVSQRMSDKSFPLLGMRSNELTLEDIFLKLTAGSDFSVVRRDPVSEEAPLEDELEPEVLEVVAETEEVLEEDTSVLKIGDAEVYVPEVAETEESSESKDKTSSKKTNKKGGKK